MGRKRQTYRDLPKRLYYKNGAFWYVKNNKWRRLGTDERKAVEMAEKLNDPSINVRMVAREINQEVADQDRKRKQHHLSRRRNREGLDLAMRWARKAHKTITERAKTRGMEIDLSLEDVQELAASTRGVCQVSGVPFSNMKPEGAFRRPWMPSIDRIDCSEGYVKGNCRIVCVAANLAMNDFGPRVLARLSHGIAKYQIP